MKVREAMTSPAICVSASAPLKAAARLMTRHGVSALPVTDASGTLVGMVSESDLLAYETAPDARLHLLTSPPEALPADAPRVADAMHTPVITVDADGDLGLATERMLDCRVKRVPVLEDGRVIGVLSRHALVKLLAEPDEMVRAGILRLLADEGLPTGGVVVAVKDGIATVSSEASAADLNMAEMLARTVPGVLGVRNLPARSKRGASQLPNLIRIRLRSTRRPSDG